MKNKFILISQCVICKLATIHGSVLAPHYIIGDGINHKALLLSASIHNRIRVKKNRQITGVNFEKCNGLLFDSFFCMNRTSNDFRISLNGGLTEKISIDGKMDQRLYKNSYKYILTYLIGNLVLGKKVKKSFLSLF